VTNRLTKAAETLPGDTSANTGTIRVGTNTAVIASSVWVIEQFTDLDVDATNPLFIAGAAAVVMFGYRLSRFVAAVKPGLAWVLFGIGDAPKYADEAD